MRSELPLLIVAAAAIAGPWASPPLRAEEGKPPAAESAGPEGSSEATESREEAAEPPSSPLTPIIEKMKSAGTRLDQGLLDQETRETQKQIVADLEKLLRQSRQKSQGPQSSSDSSGNQNPSDLPSDSGGSEGGGTGGAGQRRQDQEKAAESTERTQGGVPTDAERKNQRRVLTDAVWGHLPPRVREQLNRSINDRYLPEYEALVKRYYEALATRRRDAGGRTADDERSPDSGPEAISP